MTGAAPIQVAAALIVHEGRYLITQRRADVHLGGLWEFPGGKRESGESLEDCLRRELREELGIEISLPVLFRVIRHDYPEKSVELHFFKCAIASDLERWKRYFENSIPVWLASLKSHLDAGARVCLKNGDA